MTPESASAPPVPGPETSDLKPGTTATPAPPAPPRKLASLRELGAVFRAERETVFTVGTASEGAVQVAIRWRTLVDAEKVPLEALLRMTVSPVRFGEDGQPVAVLNDPAMRLQEARREAQRRALAVFYGVPELQREFQQAAGQPAPAPAALDEATIEALAAFVGERLPQDLVMAIERLVLSESVEAAVLADGF